MSLLSPWFTVAAIFWLQSISNTSSNFSVYSSKLKSHLQINQIQLNNLAVASDIGMLFGWCSTVAADHLPLWSVLAIGSTIGFIAYGAQYIFLGDESVNDVSYWKYFLLQILAGNSVCWVGTACGKALKRSFPKEHANSIVWLSKCYNVLSADMYICLAKEVLGTSTGNESVYLLLNSLVPLGLSLLIAPFLIGAEPARTEDGTGKFWVLAIGGATAVYAVVESVVPDSGNGKARLTISLIMVGLVGVVPVLKAGEIARKRGSRVSPVALTVEMDGDIEAESEEEKKAGENRVDEDESKSTDGEGRSPWSSGCIVWCICAELPWDSCIPIT